MIKEKSKILNEFPHMLNSEQTDEGCDATGDHSSNAVDKQYRDEE